MLDEVPEAVCHLKGAASLCVHLEGLQLLHALVADACVVEKKLNTVVTYAALDADNSACWYAKSRQDKVTLNRVCKIELLTSTQLAGGQGIVPGDIRNLRIERDRIRRARIRHVRADVEFCGSLLQVDARGGHLGDVLALDFNVLRNRLGLLDQILLVRQSFQVGQMLCLRK